MVAGCQGMAENGILRKGAVTQVTALFIDNTNSVVICHKTSIDILPNFD
jgi:hypothetical protein